METLADLRRLGHDLKGVWSRFKTAFPDAQLSSFDRVICDLHMFERLRYPDALLVEGMRLQTALYSGQLVNDTGARKRREPSYQLVLEDVDALVKLIFSRTGINPQFFLGSLHGNRAKHFLTLNNAHPLA